MTGERELKIGQTVRIHGDHPWAGESAEIIGFCFLRLMYRLRRNREDAMDGHQFYARSGCLK